jgi:hypothetical protein
MKWQANVVMYVHQNHLTNYVRDKSVEAAASNINPVQVLVEVTEQNEHESNESQDRFP